MSLQPIEDRGISAPGCPGLVCNRFDSRNRLALHLQVHFGVTIRCGQAGMTQILADGRQIDSRLQKRYRRAVATMPISA